WLPSKCETLKMRSFIKNVIEFLQNSASRKTQQLLLMEDNMWEVFVAEAELSREEADALCDALNGLAGDMALKDNESFQKCLQDRYRFWDKFPRVKMEIEEHIKKLQDIAYHVDKMHRDCTISNVVADSTGVASGILTILGLILAPFTSGSSLMLTGIGLGAAAGVTSISTTAEANQLVSTSERTLNDISEAMGKMMCEVYSKIKEVRSRGKAIRDIKQGRAIPDLEVKDWHLKTSGITPAQSIEQIKRAFGRTASALAKASTRIIGAASRGVFLLLGVHSLVNESVHLSEGAETGLAKELRRAAQELEGKLEELVQIQQSLQSDLTP
uniref:Apolipoprotein L3 n=1 Tax=Castor canadensis TaxID=51338 RepID=A0A8C0WNE6_CASCN